MAQSNTAQVLGLQVRCALDGHGAAAEEVGGFVLGAREAECCEQVEVRVGQLLVGDAERVPAEGFAQRIVVERVFDVEGARQGALEPLQDLGREALGRERLVVDLGGTLERAAADREAHDVVDLLGEIAEPRQRLRHHAVDDLEVAAARQLLELDQREVGLDAGRVAVHDQADRAGRRDHRGLGVAVAVGKARLERLVPGLLGRLDQLADRHARGIDRDRPDREALVVALLAVGGAPVVADHPQHRLAVRGEAREGPELARHLGRDRVGGAGHERGDGTRERPALVAVVGDAGGHQQAAEIGVAEAERAVAVGQFGDLLGRVLRHHDRDLEHDGPQAHGVGEARDVEPAVVLEEGYQVEGGEIARRVVEEHVLRARIRGVDPARGRAGVPLVDRGVVLDAGIGAAPGGVRDLVPELARRQGPRDLPVGAAEQLPLAILQHPLQELARDPDRVVGVLAGDREVGVRIPVGRIDRQLDPRVALAGEQDRLLERVLGQKDRPRAPDRLLELEIVLGAEARLAIQAARVAGAKDRVQVPGEQLRARDQGRDLLLLGHLPADEVQDVRMVDVDHHHLGGAPRGAAGLDGAGRAVADLEEAHEAGRLAAARERLVLAAQAREVGARAGAVFEQARLAHPEIHDPARIDQVVRDALDEAGVRLRPLVGRERALDLAGPVVGEIVPLRRAVDAIGPMQAGVEPLGRVGGRILAGEHEAELVEEALRIRLAVEIAALPAPPGPGAGEPVEHLPGRGLAAVALALGQGLEGGLIGAPAPQPGGHVRLVDRGQTGRDPGLAEILLGEHVDRDLRPGARHLDLVEPEDHRPVRVADLAGGGAKADAIVGRAAHGGEDALDPHPANSNTVPVKGARPGHARGSPSRKAAAGRAPTHRGVGSSGINLVALHLMSLNSLMPIDPPRQRISRIPRARPPHPATAPAGPDAQSKRQASPIA